MLFGECKWSNKKVGINILEELKRKSELVKIDRKIRNYVVFSKSGFTDDLKEISKIYQEGDRLNYLIVEDD